MEHFLSAADADAGELTVLLDRADALKRDRHDRRASSSTMITSDLRGRSVALLFEKPSLRTRMSLEVGVEELGGRSVVLSGDEVGMGDRESVADTARVMSRYVDAIVLRTFGQDRLEGLAAAATVPVVNALSDREHPCQALADLQTLREAKGGPAGLALAYVGDGNNVAHSLLLAGARLGVDVRVGHPPGYGPDGEVVAAAREHAEGPGAVTVTTDPAAAVAGVDAVYTDVWASMGAEDEAAERRRAFDGYGVTPELMAGADPDAIFLHCLPAHRGEEVAAEVIDGPSSRVFDQAENRLHTQKALLATLLDRHGARGRGR